MAETISLKEQFDKTLALQLKQELKKDNIWAVPRLKMVKINAGIGPLIQAKKDYSDVIENIGAITGQKPVVTKARQAISNFKIRQGLPVGITVTLRGKRMYDFVNKLINVTFPRIRDFRGFPQKILDGRGNVSVGITENTVFPEINPDSVDKIHGLQITMVTTANNDEDGYALFKAMGFPFQQKKEIEKNEEPAEKPAKQTPEKSPEKAETEEAEKTETPS